MIESFEDRWDKRERQLIAELEAFGPRPTRDPDAARERDILVAKLNAVRKIILRHRQGRFNFGSMRAAK